MGASRGVKARPPTRQADVRRIMTMLETQHPGADTELHYTNAFELLVATILSAQCTDARVNKVTPALFQRYRDAHALAGATPAQLEPQIQPTGFYRSKAKSLLGMAPGWSSATPARCRHGWTTWCSCPASGARRPMSCWATRSACRVFRSIATSCGSRTASGWRARMIRSSSNSSSAAPWTQGSGLVHRTF